MSCLKTRSNAQTENANYHSSREIESEMQAFRTFMQLPVIPSRHPNVLMNHHLASLERTVFDSMTTVVREEPGLFKNKQVKKPNMLKRSFRL